MTDGHCPSLLDQTDRPQPCAGKSKRLGGICLHVFPIPRSFLSSEEDIVGIVAAPVRWAKRRQCGLDLPLATKTGRNRARPFPATVRPPYRRLTLRCVSTDVRSENRENDRPRFEHCWWQGKKRSRGTLALLRTQHRVGTVGKVGRYGRTCEWQPDPTLAPAPDAELPSKLNFPVSKV